MMDHAINLPVAQSAPRATSRIALVGCGAMGMAVLRRLQDSSSEVVAFVVVRERHIAATRKALLAIGCDANVVSELDAAAHRHIDLLVECAGHGAIAEHVVAALAAGVPSIIASVGALHDDELMSEVNTAAQRGNTRATLIPGAIAAIDALAAAALGELHHVSYVGRKPPLSWRGTPAESAVNLEALTSEQIIFNGTARDAVRLYPKNANVAATVAMAGMGFDATRVQLIADPKASRNIHQLIAEGGFGRFEMTIENNSLPENPKTSALTVLSVLRAIGNHAARVAL
jgi:aspartate dehydrogenase